MKSVLFGVYIGGNFKAMENYAKFHNKTIVSLSLNLVFIDKPTVHMNLLQF